MTRLVGNLGPEKIVGLALAEIPQSQLISYFINILREKYMETLKSYLETQKSLTSDKVINLDNLTVIKQNKNGTVNCSTKINGKSVVINYINPKLIKGDTITVRFGKKNAEWQQSYWYQVDDDNEDKEE